MSGTNADGTSSASASGRRYDDFVDLGKLFEMPPHARTYAVIKLDGTVLVNKKFLEGLIAYLKKELQK